MVGGDWREGIGPDWEPGPDYEGPGFVEVDPV